MRLGELLIRLNLIMTSVQSVIRRTGPFELFAEITQSHSPRMKSPNIVNRNQHNQLYCRTGFHLIIKADGVVRGTRDQYNSYSILEFITVAVAVVAIKSVHTGLYLTVSPKGDLIGMTELTQSGLFTERISSSTWFNTYTAIKRYKGRSCRISLSRSGKPRAGCRAKQRQQASHFLPRRVHSSMINELLRGEHA